MSDRPTFRKGEVSQLVYDAIGGGNSPLREEITVQLGNPNTGELFLPDEIKQYENQVWLSDVVGDFPLADTDDTEREDSPGGLYVGFLPAGALPAGKRRFGTTVKAVWRDHRYVVMRETVDGANYNRGVPENERAPVSIKEFDYGLLRPTQPPSGRVMLSESIHPGTSNWEQLVIKSSDDLIATYAGALTLGQARAIKIESDPADNSITYTAGSAFTNTSRDAETGAVDHSAVFSNYPRTLDSTQKLHGWVLLYYQMTAITEQDILPALDYGRGAGISDAADLTYTPADNTDWSGSADPGNTDDALDQLADRVTTLEGAGGGGGISDGYRLRGSGDACGASTSTKLTFSEIFDTNGYYNAGTNVQTPSVGHWTHMAYVALALNDDATAFGYISVYITGEYASELPITQTQLTIFTMSGVTVDFILAFPICTGGNVDTPNEFELWVDNFSGQDATVQDCWIEGLRTGNQLTTP